MIDEFDVVEQSCGESECEFDSPEPEQNSPSRRQRRVPRDLDAAVGKECAFIVCSGMASTLPLLLDLHARGHRHGVAWEAVGACILGIVVSSLHFLH